MDSRSVQVRPQQPHNADEIETFIESLIGCTVSTTPSRIPVFSFKTSDANVEKIKTKFGDDVIVDIVGCD